MLTHDEFVNKLKSNEPYVLAISAINDERIKQMFIEDHDEFIEGNNELNLEIENYGLERFNTCHDAIENSIYDGEIINIEHKLDNLIYDTIPQDVDIHLPYENFFINKYFEFDDFLICGIAFCKTEYGTAMIIPVFDISQNNYGNFDCMTGVLPNHILNIGKINIYNNAELIRDKLENDENPDELKQKINAKGMNFMAHVSVYIANVLNLFTIKNNDIHYVTRKTTDRQKETLFGVYNPQVRPVINVSVKGEFEKYIIKYNKIKKSKKFKKLTTVRGFWRYYKDDKFVNMKGKKQWIAPHFRGSGKEIMHKFILISE